MTRDSLVRRLDAGRHWLVTLALVAASVAVALSWMIHEVAIVCAEQSAIGVGACLPTLELADLVVRLAAMIALSAFAVVLSLDYRARRLDIETYR